MNPRVYNICNHDAPDDAVYVGRPSKFGNPFSHKGSTMALFRVESREEAVEAYREMIINDEELLQAAKDELAGRDLICWCAEEGGITTNDKLICHAQVLLRIANNDNPKQ